MQSDLCLIATERNAVGRRDHKWAELFNDFSERNISIVNLMKVIEFIFCLRGSSVPLEWLFSITNSVWSLDRSRMLKSTVQVLLFGRINTKLTCLEFYEKIENNQTFLQKIVSSQKCDLKNEHRYLYCMVTSNKNVVSYTFFLFYRKHADVIVAYAWGIIS